MYHRCPNKSKEFISYTLLMLWLQSFIWNSQYYKTQVYIFLDITSNAIELTLTTIINHFVIYYGMIINLIFIHN